MISSSFSDRYVRVQDAEGQILVEATRTSNARDLRGQLLQLAYALDREAAGTTALCMLVDTRLSALRLQEELENFRRVVSPNLARRVFLVGRTQQGAFEGVPHPRMATIERALELRASGQPGPARATRQSVKAHLLRAWLAHEPPMGMAELGRETGASYPTVAAALEDLKGMDAVRQDAQRRFALRTPDWETWHSLAREQAKEYRAVHYVDPTGHASVSKLIQRLRGKSLAAAGELRIGGVVGAAWYEPHVDITAAPRLDVYASGQDTAFVSKLDAALEASTSPQERPVLIVHLGRNKATRQVFAPIESPEVAPPLECVADLLDLGFQAEARDFALALTKARARSE